LRQSQRSNGAIRYLDATLPGRCGRIDGLAGVGYDSRLSRLPSDAMNSAAAATSMSAETVEPPDLSTATILLVDDNQQNLELMQAYLEALPCRLRTATDGVEAMQMIEQECPDLILLDVMMPRMSGFEVCHKVKSSPATRDVVVIMVTALHEVGDYERAVECGTTDFITKPVNKHELLTRVRSLLELRLVKKRYDQLMSLSQRRGPDDRQRPGAGENLE
jgi:CheY-like chemotaxis protein